MIASVSQSDIAAIEEAADALIRARCTETAIKLYALALRLRGETQGWGEIGQLLRETDSRWPVT